MPADCRVAGKPMNVRRNRLATGADSFTCILFQDCRDVGVNACDRVIGYLSKIQFHLPHNQ